MIRDVLLDSLGSGVFEIRIERHDRMNALEVATVAALHRVVRNAGEQGARVLLIRGSGRAFCAGADLKERKAMDLDGRMAHDAGIKDAINAIANAPNTLRCSTSSVRFI